MAVHQHSPSKLVEPERFFQEWEKLPNESYAKFVWPFNPRRLAAVIAANSALTKYHMMGPDTYVNGIVQSSVCNEFKKKQQQQNSKMWKDWKGQKALVSCTVRDKKTKQQKQPLSSYSCIPPTTKNAWIRTWAEERTFSAKLLQDLEGLMMST